MQTLSGFRSLSSSYAFLVQCKIFCFKLRVSSRRSLSASFMAVPAEPNAEALANLIQDQGQPLVQDQQIQDPEQQPQAPPGAAAAQVHVGEVFCSCSLFIFVALCCASRCLFPCPGLSFCYFCFVFHSHYRVHSLHVRLSQSPFLRESSGAEN